MKYGTTINLDLDFPCDFFGDVSDLEMLLDDWSSTYLISDHMGSYEYGADLLFDVNSVYSNIQNSKSYINLDISAELPTVDSISEEDFIRLYRAAFNGYKKYLVDTINSMLESFDLFGYLPDANVTYLEDRLFVEIEIGQSDISLSTSSAYVEDNEDTDDQLSDMYFSK